MGPGELPLPGLTTVPFGSWRGGTSSFASGTKELVITVDRLKPAFGFADPAPAPAGEEKKMSMAKVKTGRALDPRAEIFVPGKQPKERAIPSREAEGKKTTTAKSGAGRPLRPPDRFGARSL